MHPPHPAVEIIAARNDPKARLGQDLKVEQLAKEHRRSVQTVQCCEQRFRGV
jgi:hypothetical protein